MEKKNYPGLDIMKFIGAFMVVAIHTFPLAVTHYPMAHFIRQVITRVAVPFYFACAGFFYVRGFDTGKNKRLSRYMKRLFILYLGWSLIYLPLAMGKFLGHTDGRLFPALGLYLHEAVFTGTFYHLWYLPALIFAVLLLHGALMTDKLMAMAVFALICYGAGLLNDSYYGLVRSFPGWVNFWDGYNQIFFTTRNGLCFGLAYVVLGALIGRQREMPSRRLVRGGFILSLLLFLLEYFLLKNLTEPRDYNMYLTLLPLTYFLFSFCERARWGIIPEKSVRIRSWGMGIYFSHVLFMELFRETLGWYQGTELFFAVSLASFAVVFLIDRFRVPPLWRLVR